MISVESQRKEFAIVISDLTRCHYDYSDFFTWLNNSGFRYWFIVHDKDVDNQGQLVRPHIHLVLSGNKRWRVKQLINQLSDCLITNNENIQVMEVVNLVASVQYLLHKNDVDKFQYSIDRIFTNDSQNLVSMMNETITFERITTDRLINLIMVEEVSKLELIKIMGIGSYAHYRNAINDIYELKSRRGR